MDEFIEKFLDGSFIVTENGYASKHDLHEIDEGRYIVLTLLKTFSLSEDEAFDIFYKWSIKNNLSGELFNRLYRRKPLKVTWSPELTQDVSIHHNIDAEAELISMLSEEIANEIDAAILKDLNGKLDTNSFLSVVKCLGYETGPTIFDPMTFAPFKRFLPISLREMRYERQNNAIWQNWVRTREQNQET